jgi:Lrp/AsnC family transcriptional regulator, leucine-responsive regulatory protein
MNTNEQIMSKMDEIDLHMLEILKTGGRISVLELADRVGLSPTPCSRRLRRMESEGIIAKYHAALSPRAAGLELVCQLLGSRKPRVCRISPRVAQRLESFV